MMKTKKITVYILAALFIFSPMFNLEGWAMSRTYPIIMPPIMALGECPVIKPICYQIGNQICCEHYCCESSDLRHCVLGGEGPVCGPIGNGSNLLK